MTKIPTENIVNINDDSIRWADLGDRFRGYQYSNTGLLRSMKFFKKYPLGVIIESDSSGMYELSNCFNQREKISISDIESLCRGKYNIPTYSTVTRSRNPLITSKSKTMEINRSHNKFDMTPKPAHFTIIKDN